MQIEVNPRFFEGCGREGPIKCIFLCEFHPVAGPRITHQVPNDYISKEVFDAVSVYIIPKPQLQRTILTVNTLGYKITGYPVKIDSPKYARNAYYFNLCFVCDAWARTVQYEAVVKKLSEYLVYLEEESGFLSKENSTEGEYNLSTCNLTEILETILEDLNTKRISTVSVGSINMYLKVVKICSDPPEVSDHHVPVFVHDISVLDDHYWDLTTQQLLPHIDGFNHVAKIAVEADVENNLVKYCIQNLVYYGAVKLVTVFLYSNVYAVTPELKMLLFKKKLQEECLNYVSLSDGSLATLRDVFFFYSSMVRGTTLRDLCVRLNPHSLHIDERKLVQFGLLHKLIRRIHKYPVFLENDGCTPGTTRALTVACNGVLCYDELSCSSGCSHQQLDEQLESNSSTVVIWK